MSFYRLQILFIISFVFYMLFHQSYQLQLSTDFPQLDSSRFHNSYFSITRNKKQRPGKIKSVQVYDYMACIQQCSQMTDGSVQFTLFASYKNCAEIWKRGTRMNDVYDIVLAPSTSLQVYCDMVTSGGGWTVIQKRLDGSVDFYRSWDDYKRGFGNKFGEYWLGLDAIHALTSQGSYRLRVDMEDFEGNTTYAEYDSFNVADEADNYRLTIGAYTGNAGDSLRRQNNSCFTTKDRDNDEHSNNCAVMYAGA
ncbi:hypothetical protein QZH41_020438, partial [Actinostola sp. cb2023]